MNRAIYKPRFFRTYQLIGIVIKVLGKILMLWPLLLLLWALLAPASPHLQVTYTYAPHTNPRYKLTCDYIGLRGWVTQYSAPGGTCPVIKLIRH